MRSFATAAGLLDSEQPHCCTASLSGASYDQLQHSPRNALQARGKYIIDGKIMEQLQPHAVVMHPLPRVDEITTDVDSDPRAAYFRQVGAFRRVHCAYMYLQDNISAFASCWGKALLRTLSVVMQAHAWPGFTPDVSIALWCVAAGAQRPVHPHGAAEASDAGAAALRRARRAIRYNVPIGGALAVTHCFVSIACGCWLA